MPEKEFPEDDKVGECKDCKYFNAYEQGGTIGYCSKVLDMISIHNTPVVHETCWCPRFEEDE